MRFITICAAAMGLAGCNREAPDNRAAEAGPVQTRPDAPTRTIQASFDCGRARGQAQELVCADAGLAAMDREVARLASIAAEPAGQAQYDQQRDNCWKADELRHCVTTAATLEIHRLRKGLQSAPPTEGLSNGPIPYSCTGIAGPVLATFVTGDRGGVAIEWGGDIIAIDHVPTASGARYDGRWNGQAYAFWNKGREATFTVPGKGDLQCAEQTD